MSDSKNKKGFAEALGANYAEETEEEIINKRGKTTFHARRNPEKKELI